MDDVDELLNAFDAGLFQDFEPRYDSGNPRRVVSEPCCLCLCSASVKGGAKVARASADGTLSCSKCGQVLPAQSGEVKTPISTRSDTPISVKERCGPVASDLLPSSSVGWCVTGPVQRGAHHSDRAMLKASRDIRALAQNSCISPATISVAERMFKTALDRPEAVRVRREGLVEGALYAALRVCGTPRTVPELAATFQCETSVLRHGIKRIFNALWAEADGVESSKGPRLAKAEDFVSRFLAHCPFKSRSNELLASVFEQYAHEMGLVPEIAEMPPHVVAAVALVFSWEHLGQSHDITDASKASGVASSTIRRALRSMSDHRRSIMARVSRKVMGPDCMSSASILAWAVSRAQTPPPSNKENCVVGGGG